MRADFESIFSGLMESFKGALEEWINHYGKDDTGWHIDFSEYFDCDHDIDTEEVSRLSDTAPSPTLSIDCHFSYWVGRYINDENEGIFIGIGPNLKDHVKEYYDKV